MDNFPVPGLDLIVMTSAAVGLTLVILIIILRSRSESAAGTILEDETTFDDPSIEYEWVSKPRVWGKVMLFLFSAGGILIAVFFVDELRTLLSSIYQIGIVLLGLLSSVFANAFKKYKYRITSIGVYRSEIGKKGDPKLLFTWQRLAWFTPKSHGFRYYLKPGGEETLNLTSSGFVLAGDRAMLVNAMIMSRGVPTSPPNREGSYKESRRSFDRS